MKKVLFSLLLLVSVSAFAADVSLSFGAVKDRPSNARGSIGRLSIQDGSIGYGLQTETVGGTSRNQADASYTLLDAAGFNASAGLGGVTETNVKSHVVYLGKVGYVYDFGNKLSANVGLAYRNDFSRDILDRQMSAKVGGAYALNTKSAIGLSYARGYGDSKKDTVALAYNSKF